MDGPKTNKGTGAGVSRWGLKKVRLKHYEVGEGKQNLRERCDLQDLGINGRIVLNGSSGHNMGVWTGLIWLTTGLL